MFEKEAKERARKLEESQTLGVYDSDEDYARDSGWNDGEVAGYEEGFKDGAEFVYNNAKELEEQIEKMKCLLNEIYSEYGFSELVKIRNNLPIEIQEVIKEIK